MVHPNESYTSQTRDSLLSLKHALGKLPAVATNIKTCYQQIEDSELTEAEGTDRTRELLAHVRAEWKDLICELESTKHELDSYREQVESRPVS